MSGRVYCLDASTCTLLSEDYPGTTRWHFQKELVACHSRACLLGAAGTRFSSLAGTSTQRQQQVALITGTGGRAGVALHPTSEAQALQQALDEVQPSGESNLAASLKLSLLVSRRFQGASTHVTAFVASPGAAASLATEAPDLHQRYLGAGVSLDVAVLCPRHELGDDAAAALAALTGAPTDSSSSSSCSGAGSSSEQLADEDKSSSIGGSSSSMRLLWLQPVSTAAESWQQLEPALEQLEGSGSRDASRLRPPAASSSGPRSALPGRISRAPRQFDPLRHPRTPLLAQRSGVQQPALCRAESLSRLGHLSSDGMMRPWLPTYSSIGQQAAAAAAGAGAGGGAGSSSAAGSSSSGGGSAGEYCYVEVQPIPKWRTLIKVAAGRMLATPARGASPTSAGSGGSAGSSPRGNGDYAAASSRLLRSLEALSVLDDDQGSGPSSGEGAAEAAAAPAGPPAPVRYHPDATRGTLRLLQATKEPHLLKLVWSASAESAAAGSAGSISSWQQGPQAQPLDMFASSGSSNSSGSSLHAELLSFMPSSAVTASAARGPLVVEGCELWEAAAEFDWELLLPTPDSEDRLAPAAAATAAAAAGPPGSRTSSSSGSAEGLPAEVQARELPSGAQLVLVTPTSGSRGSSIGSSSGARLARQRGQQRAPVAAAFWLQQRIECGSLELPAYGTATANSSSRSSAGGSGSGVSLPPPESAAPATDSTAAAAVQAAPCVGSVKGAQDDSERPQHAQQQQEQEGQVELEPQGPAALLAAALLRTLQQPPRVDLRRLRRDVKSGVIQVTPVTVGPLPAQFVRDIVSTRSAMMGGLGVENLDSWEGGSPGAGGDPATGKQSASGKSSSSSSSNGVAGDTQGCTTASGSSSQPPAGVGNLAGVKKAQAEPGRPKAAGLALLEADKAEMSRHKAVALSILRQRLIAKRHPPPQKASGGEGGGSSSSSAALDAALEQERQPASGPAAPGAEGASCATPIPCSSPQPTPQPPLPCLADSYSSSTGGTPFGTPLHILPSGLLHQRHGVGATEEAAGAGLAAESPQMGTDAASMGPADLRGTPGSCVKREGSAVLVGAGSQTDSAADTDPLFQLE